MQKIYLLFFILFCFTNCDNDDDTPQNPADQLPEATQTGAGTFACLVDGKPFIGDNPYFNCYYQYVDGGWYFGIGGKQDNTDLRQIILASNKTDIEEGEEYNLGANVEESYYAECSFKGVGVGSDTETTMQGKLLITKLDFENYIVSGTFWFNLKHPVTGDTIKIREGRFDTLFGM